jgi:hypothetical protein
VSDVLFPLDRPEIGGRALAAVDDLARSLGIEAILCSASHPVLARVLRDQAYVGIPANGNFLTRTAKGQPPLSQPLERWWLTRADANADDVF